MGIDIYMKWKGQTKKEQKEQITGFSIEAGNVGYLRASYGMATECELLYLIFPASCWVGKAVTYDFTANLERVLGLLNKYLSGEKIEVSDETEKRRRTFKAVKNIFSQMNYKNITPKGDDEGKKIWVKSIVDFFKLGIRLQNEKKLPKIYISY